jgi:hypothetical protein
LVDYDSNEKLATKFNNKLTIKLYEKSTIKFNKVIEPEVNTIILIIQSFELDSRKLIKKIDHIALGVDIKIFFYYSVEHMIFILLNGF